MESSMTFLEVQIVHANANSHYAKPLCENIVPFQKLCF